MPPFRSVSALAVPFALALGATLASGAPAPLPGMIPPIPPIAWKEAAEPVPPAPLGRLDRAAFGRSGALRVMIADPMQLIDLPMTLSDGDPGALSYRWRPMHGTRGGVLGETRLGAGVQAPVGNGVWHMVLRRADRSEELSDLAVITRVPFSEKRGGVLNGYRIGRYPTEGSGRADPYAPPAGFIEVTLENRDLHVSEHFRLRDFLTKDQHNVWPKYLALDLRLIDKLELVLQELNGMGVRADRMAVMSGFRTPQYNGPGEGGRARLSRHTYGDASDVWVDSDADGYIDDLNGDGNRDIGDALLMLRAVDRVEQRYPELVGGAGVYLDNAAHGPFIHIDARGVSSRW